MKFYNVWLRNIRGIYTWHSLEKINLGARVQVKFRGKTKLGIVIKKVAKVDFQTQEICEIIDKNFINSKYLEISEKVAYENLCSWEKVLNLMIPEKFLTTENPAKKEIFYGLNQNLFQKTEQPKIRGKNQMAIIEYLTKNKSATKDELLNIAGQSTINNLEKKGFLWKKCGKFLSAKFPIEKIARKIHPLTNEQKRVLSEVEQKKCPSLLFGVTGSGKTEIYKNLAKKYSLNKKTGQTLFLLPEIALTPQLIAEFRGIFGDQMAVWHSKLSAGEKIQEWARCVSGEAKILIGARSAVFVPLQNPQLIILDEEHEWTFKSEFAPRIWTHDLAEKIAKKFQAKLVFGSATPRIESFEKCKNQEWDLVELKKRVSEVQMPEIMFVDLKNEGKKGNFSPISEKLEAEIAAMLKRKNKEFCF